jgi:hypothetical protein
MLRTKLMFDTQIISNVNSGSIPADEWRAVLAYMSKKCRYVISVNTFYELLSSIANGDQAHFLTNQNRIRLLYAPAQREFLPLVGDFVRSTVFALPIRKRAFEPSKLKLWADVVLAAKRKSDLKDGKVVLRGLGHARRRYGFDLPLLLKQIAVGKKSHAQRLEKLRLGELAPSTSATWSRAVLNLIGGVAADANAAKVLSALDAAYCYDVSLYEMAANHNYDFGRHDTDWIDSQQLYYLSDPSLCIVTSDANLVFRTRTSNQRDRILTFNQLKARASH